MKKLLQQKCKLQKWKTVARSSSSKCVRETVYKSDSLHQRQKGHQPEPSSRSGQDKVRRKPSLKWKFCHAVASVVAANDTDISKTVDSPIASATESDVEDSKPEISATRPTSANSKKKKKKRKRKSAAGQKKSLCISAVLSNSGKKQIVKNC
jgi:hypothetical protein